MDAYGSYQATDWELLAGVRAEQAENRRLMRADFFGTEAELEHELEAIYGHQEFIDQVILGLPRKDTRSQAKCCGFGAWVSNNASLLVYYYY